MQPTGCQTLGRDACWVHAPPCPFPRWAVSKRAFFCCEVSFRRILFLRVAIPQLGSSLLVYSRWGGPPAAAASGRHAGRAELLNRARRLCVCIGACPLFNPPTMSSARRPRRLSERDGYAALFRHFKIVRTLGRGNFAVWCAGGNLGNVGDSRPHKGCT